MRKNSLKNGVKIAFLIILFSTMIFNATLPSFETATTTVVSVSPADQQVGQEGQLLPKSFSINVTVTDVTDLFAWQAMIFYSSRVLNATGATYPTGHVFDGKQFQELPFENVTYQKKLTNETYVNFSNPVGIEWSRVEESSTMYPSPKGVQRYNTTAWLDKDESGTLTVGDVVFLEPKKYPVFMDYYYMDKIEWEGSGVNLYVSMSYVQFGATLLGGQSTFNGTGILCEMSFNAIRPGNRALNFSTSGTTLLNSTLGDISRELIDGNVRAYGTISEEDKDSSAISINVPSTVKVGSTVTISGTITPWKPGVNVTIYYKPPGGTSTALATVTTDHTGIYTYSWNTTKVGDYEFYAKWEGDAETKAAESEKKTVSVTETGEKAPPIDYLLYIAVAIVIIVVVAVVLYFVKFRKPRK